MDDRNDIHSPDEQKNPMEIPSNEPESETQPIRASKSNRTDGRYEESSSDQHVSIGMIFLYHLPANGFCYTKNEVCAFVHRPRP